MYMKQIIDRTPAGVQTQERLPPSVQAPQAVDSGGSSKMTVIIGGVLQGGVIVSSAVILIGLLMLLLRSPQLSERYLATFPHTFGQIWTGLLGLHPQSIIALGLIMLILTPVMRVAISIVAFALEHDRLYVVITSIVLLILIAGFLLQKGGA
jgi:uncharacterized membrane protein